MAIEGSRISAEVAGFYACPNLAGRSIAIVLLNETKWNDFLKGHGGIPKQPFYSRPCRASEPATHANGHPWAWVYTPDEALKDEARWLASAEYERFDQALKCAVSQLQSQMKSQMDEVHRMNEASEVSRVAGVSTLAVAHV